MLLCVACRNGDVSAKLCIFEVSDGLSGCTVYVFEDENGFFIEQPYNGIFSIEEKQYAEIFETLF